MGLLVLTAISPFDINVPMQCTLPIQVLSIRFLYAICICLAFGFVYFFQYNIVLGTNVQIVLFDSLL